MLRRILGLEGGHDKSVDEAVPVLEGRPVEVGLSLAEVADAGELLAVLTGVGLDLHLGYDWCAGVACSPRIRAS